jgi:asparagine synthase (glutamine-hydrolysing)
MARLIPENHTKARSARLKRMLLPLGLPPAKRYSTYVRLFDDALLRKLLMPGVRDYFWLEFDRISTHYEAALANQSQVDAAMSVDRIFYLPDDLLTKVDRSSMAFALEVRSPMMDHDLVQFASHVSACVHTKHGSKSLLRKAFAADLPEEVFNRPKMGFAVPIGEWFCDSLRPMLHGLLTSERSFAGQYFQRQTVAKMIDDHISKVIDHTQRLYALLMLELWFQER